jgi:hypothetical protein
VNPVLATERKTPLRESEPASTGRSRTTAQRSQVARRRAIVGALAALVLIAVIAFLVTRGGDGGIFNGGSTAPPPEFAFTLKSASYVPTEKDGNKSAQNAAARDVGGKVKGTLDDLYFTAFVDPDTWGDAGEIDDLFTSDAADQIDANLDALTLGADAGDTYTYVDPDAGTLTVKVLTNAKGEALQAFAKTSFVATATHTDGSFTKITVTGSFFLAKDGDTWKIQSFDVNRAEKATRAPAASASSPSEAGQ